MHLTAALHMSYIFISNGILKVTVNWLSHVTMNRMVFVVGIVLLIGRKLKFMVYNILLRYNTWENLRYTTY